MNRRGFFGGICAAIAAPFALFRRKPEPGVPWPDLTDIDPWEADELRRICDGRRGYFVNPGASHNGVGTADDPFNSMLSVPDPEWLDPGSYVWIEGGELSEPWPTIHQGGANGVIIRRCTFRGSGRYA